MQVKLTWNADVEAVLIWNRGDADELRYKVAKEMGQLKMQLMKML